VLHSLTVRVCCALQPLPCSIKFHAYSDDLRSELLGSIPNLTEEAIIHLVLRQANPTVVIHVAAGDCSEKHC